MKLETTRQRPDEILLVWRRPNGDVAKAIANVEYAPGDKVICAEWLGDGEMPSPHWYGDRLLSKLEPAAHDYIVQALGRVGDADRPKAFAPVPAVTDYRASQLTDNELLHICLGVET